MTLLTKCGIFLLFRVLVYASIEEELPDCDLWIGVSLMLGVKIKIEIQI